MGDAKILVPASKSFYITVFYPFKLAPKARAINCNYLVRNGELIYLTAGTVAQ